MSEHLGPQVCRSCKIRKRKCNKSLPRCSSCLKRNATCDYDYGRRRATGSPTPPTHSEESRAHIEAPDDGLESQHLDQSTILFLDPTLLQLGYAAAPACHPIPAHIKTLLGSQDELRGIVDHYFNRIHTWLPIIGKKRWFSTAPLSHLRPEQALLLLSMRLFAELPPARPHNARTPLYKTTKHYVTDVEAFDALSLPVLQAQVLVALYELGHGIYPAAYLTIGACARYAYALGVGPNPAKGTRKVMTLVEAEEKRRVWWAILIIDRFVSIGCPGRPLATAEPRLDDLLPVDDDLWDQGVIEIDKLSTLAAPSNQQMTKFALLCQAARLLGQVLQCVQRGPSADDDDEWRQLDRTVQSMLLAALEVDDSDPDHVGFVYSTLVALHAPFLSAPDKVETDERSRAAKEVVTKIFHKVQENLVKLQCLKERCPDFASPWALFFAYHVCGVLMRERRLSDPPNAVLDSMLGAFRKIDVRWHVAGTYLQLLEAQQAMAQ